MGTTNTQLPGRNFWHVHCSSRRQGRRRRFRKYRETHVAMDLQPAVSLSHLGALRRRLDVVANNIANMNTAGFQREDTMFTAALTRTKGPGSAQLDRVHSVVDLGTLTARKAGPLVPTGSSLDIAVEGDGWIAVDAADGRPAYTRAGHLKVLASGELALRSGEIVRGEGGAPILLAPEDTGIDISADGTVSSSNGVAGRIELWKLADGAQPQRLGGALVRADAAPMEPGSIRIRSGMIEGSNVEPIAEMTRMIDILRSYQSSQSMAEKARDLRADAARRLGRVQSS